MKKNVVIKDEKNTGELFKATNTEEFLRAAKRYINNCMPVTAKAMKTRGLKPRNVMKFLKGEGVRCAFSKGNIIPVPSRNYRRPIAALSLAAAAGVIVAIIISYDKSAVKTVSAAQQSAAPSTTSSPFTPPSVTKAVSPSPPVFSMGKTFHLSSRAFVVEEGVGQKKYWTMTVKAFLAKEKDTNNSSSRFKKYADAVNKNNRKAADSQFKEEDALGNKLLTKFVFANLNTPRKAILEQNLNTELFSLNSQSHWGWDNGLEAWVTSDPNGITPILYVNFNVQSKAKISRVNKRAKKLKSELEK